MLQNIIILLTFAFLLILSVAAMIHGYKGMKVSREFKSDFRAQGWGLWAFSLLHMIAGAIFILLFAAVIILNVVIRVVFAAGGV